MAKSLGYRILHFPLVNIIIGTFLCVLAAEVGAMIFALLLDLLPLGDDVFKVLYACISATLALLTYYYFYRSYEKRKIEEVSLRKIGFNLPVGLFIGAGFQCAVIAIIALAAVFTINKVNPASYMLPVLGLAISSGVVEEIIFRGIMFRVIEKSLGSYIALVISALVFGIIHITNPNSSWMMGIAIAIEAGLMLAAIYMYTRNLWMPIAIHFAWNFTQGGIFGATVSGYKGSKSLLDTTIEGNTLITGGTFGPEGSIQAIIIGLLIFLLFMWLNIKKGNIVLPFWVRKKQVATGTASA